MARKTPPMHVYDSDRDLELHEHRRFAISYEPMWQSIRHSLSWGAYEGARMSLAKVDAYVDAASAKQYEQIQRRVWRVYNLMCAIPHGQSTKIGIRMIERNATAILLPALDRYRNILKDTGYPTEWDWAWARRNATKLWQADPDDLIACYKKLMYMRGNKARRWHSKPEFWYYMALLEEVMNIVK